ncbi:hypothetical protein HKBW3S42_01378 [Candidatus Hakubella thermalkaliphila]|uniref:DUF4258 domain-containing protein n=1 Tax=Candidatus Hakubella thermalkaliphila TaxID=2754717 RepID=A0A6V8PLC6_9ACTN|nr:hypothetical protein HKBW3S42_01378 [Candidatus Hakubella thermalkaliphila]
MRTEIYFEIRTPLNVRIRTTKEYWNYIVTIKHRVMEGKEAIVKATLSEPDEIRKSKIDENVFLYYKKEDKLYCAIARHNGEDGFLITAYPTDKVKEGGIVWTK